MAVLCLRKFAVAGNATDVRAGEMGAPLAQGASRDVCASDTYVNVARIGALGDWKAAAKRLQTAWAAYGQSVDGARTPSPRGPHPPNSGLRVGCPIGPIPAHGGLEA